MHQHGRQPVSEFGPGTRESGCGSLTVRWPVVIADQSGVLSVTLTVDRSGQIGTITSAHAELSLDDAAPRTAPRVLADGPCNGSMVGFDDGLVHVESAGLIAAVARFTGKNVELLYARSPLCEKLGIKGGCVDKPTATFEAAAVEMV